MVQRKDPYFPSFWQLQFVGWGCFYLLVLMASLPFLKQAGMWLDDSIFVVSLFLASCLLRPVCRSLLRRSLPWLSFEVRVFAWSLLTGAAAAFVPDPAILGLQKMDWANWLVNVVQYSVVLFLWCSLYFSIKQWQQAAQERERLLRAESETREARLSALRYQLNPHFLFNSLNSVSTLILEGKAPAATRMLAQIGEILRTTLDNEVVPEIPLSQEIAFTERYLAIEQTRLGERLRVDLVISPETLDALVPNMLLQPLVENAVRHGIAPLLEGGTILIQSQRHDAQVQIIIKNSGALAGQSNKSSGQVAAKGASLDGGGVGLANTAERLKTLYGREHGFALEWPAEGGCEVTVELPFRKCGQEQEALACAR